MPSTKLPASIGIGPGRLPANVATASALTALPTTSFDADGSGVAVMTVGVTTTLTRQGQQLLVLAIGVGDYTITLPSDAEAGDSVTFLKTTPVSASTRVFITATGSNVNGGFVSETLTGTYTSRTYIKTATGAWLSSAEKISAQLVNASVTLNRSAPEQIVLVDTTSGDISVSLPARVQIGDRITFVKLTADSNSVTVLTAGTVRIDGRTNIQVLARYSSVRLLWVAADTWVTESEPDAFVNITDTTNLGTLSQTTAKTSTLMVHTLDAAWIAGTKTISLPSTNVLPGTMMTITDADGGAASNPIVVSSLVGWSATSPADYTMTTNYGSITVVRTGNAAPGPSTAWVIVADSNGLVDNFTTMARTSVRADGPLTRMTVNPMYNWSHRKVALHAEFAGLITNILPVEGFTAGGDIVLSPMAGVAGTVGVMRCTVPAGSGRLGYLHLGNSPTQPIFNPATLMGFRAIVTMQTAAPGDDYDVAIGFGDDISDNTGNFDQLLGANGLFMGTGASGVWRRVRKAAGTSTGGDQGALVVGNRYVIEYYTSSTGAWEGYVNGVRNSGGSTNVPTVLLNFGMLIKYDGGTVNPYVVDVDSFTIFTRDMGNTRFT